MERALLMKGKVKEAYDLGDRLEFQFTDNISVFDKIIPSTIPFKGETLSREGAYWFERASRMGIKTHFLDYLPPAGMLCKKVEILPSARITPQSRNYLIPLEWICRWYVAGSLFDRVENGTLSARDLGFPSGHAVRSGEQLPQPFLEVSTKLEKTDRLLEKEEALQISGLTPQEFEDAKEIVLKVDEDINRSVLGRGLIHADGKKELAFDIDKQIMIVDVYGTADEDRFWDKRHYEEGKLVDLSKEYVRQYYRQTGYKDILYKLREEGKADPPIPALPDDVVQETSRIYIKLFEMITGEKFKAKI